MPTPATVEPLAISAKGRNVRKPVRVALSIMPIAVSAPEAARVADAPAAAAGAPCAGRSPTSRHVRRRAGASTPRMPNAPTMPSTPYAPTAVRQPTNVRGRGRPRPAPRPCRDRRRSCRSRARRAAGPSRTPWRRATTRAGAGRRSRARRTSRTAEERQESAHPPRDDEVRRGDRGARRQQTPLTPALGERGRRESGTPPCPPLYAVRMIPTWANVRRNSLAQSGSST